MKDHSRTIYIAYKIQISQKKKKKGYSWNEPSTYSPKRNNKNFGTSYQISKF